MPFNKLFCFYFMSDAGKETTVKDDFTLLLENLESLECVLDQTGPGVIWAGQKKIDRCGGCVKKLSSLRGGKLIFVTP